MTVEWLARAFATGALLTIAALLAERVIGWFGLARRWAWAAAMAGSLLLPALALAAPGVLPEIGFPERARSSARAEAPARPPSAVSVPVPASAVSGAPRSLPRGVCLGWLAASLSMLGCVAWSYRRLDAARSGCVAVRVEGVRVLVSERAGPLVLGVLHPELLLPRWVLEAAPEERRLIVRHELEHVAGGDPWLLALATLAVALMPWNPALWAQHRRLRLALETDCDARVLAAGADRRLYGRVLLRTSGHPFALPVLAPAWGGRTSHLERRIVTMTTKPPPHRFLRAFPLSVLAVGVAAAACGLASGGGPPTDTRTRSGAVDANVGIDWASRDMSDSSAIVMVRGEPDSTLGYTGLTPYYAERPAVLHEGRRVWRRVETAPVVVGVDGGSPAERAGFREGDVILSIGGRDSREPPTVRLRPGNELTYRVRRDGRELQLRLVATAPPARAWPPSEADFAAAHRQAELLERLKAQK
jgi:hypothetical protein